MICALTGLPIPSPDGNAWFHLQMLKPVHATDSGTIFSLPLFVGIQPNPGCLLIQITPQPDNT